MLIYTKGKNFKRVFSSNPKLCSKEKMPLKQLLKRKYSNSYLNVSIENTFIALKTVHCCLLLGKRPKKKKNVFFWEISPKCGWVGWLTPKQGPNPSKPPQITPKIALFDPNFTFRTPKSHKNPGVGGWVNRFGRDLPKKTVFFWQLPLRLLRPLRCQYSAGKSCQG